MFTILFLVSIFQDNKKPGIEIALIFVTFIFALCLFILIAWEFYQIVIFRSSYFHDFENLIEWLVFIFAFQSLLFLVFLWPGNETNSDIGQHFTYQGYNASSVNNATNKTYVVELFRGVSAMGICLSWIELVFILGRSVFGYHNFAAMLFNILGNLRFYFWIICFVVIGFAGAFMAMNFQDEDGLDAFIFYIIKSIVQSLAMTFGEFTFNEIASQYSDTSVIKYFVMFIFVLLVFVGTIVMVNLFLAIIIRDVENLKRTSLRRSMDDWIKNLILFDGILQTFFNDKDLPKEEKFCVHQSCLRVCNAGSKILGTDCRKNLEQIARDRSLI